MMKIDRLSALYDELEDNRATQDGAWAASKKAVSTEDYEQHVAYMQSLVLEEGMILNEIESLGGEDPEL